MARARLDPKARRAQLVDIAYQLLDRRGLDTMSVDDVADAAGVSRSLVYAYFGDRDGLVAEVYLRVLSELDLALALPLPRDRAQLVEVIARCMAFAHERPTAWQLLATDSVRRHPLIVQARIDRVDRLAKAAGSDGAGDRLVADAMLGLIEAGVWHWVDRSDMAEQHAADVLAGVLWCGLGSHPPRDPTPPDPAV
ncbi:MAG TPA: TetR/AcrR family transcriptional regulator [Acidimicrobiales bacterium]|jgi:AcrR family transcriptional regulator